MSDAPFVVHLIICGGIICCYYILGSWLGKYLENKRHEVLEKSDQEKAEQN